MLVVGLTGGIATGKSTVSKWINTPEFPVIDADVLARKAVEPGTPGLAKIVTAFGDGILLSDGSLNRKKLGDIIFNDPTKRKVLNGIVHPAVRKAMFFGVLKYWLMGKRICILDVPLLIEAGLDRFVGAVVVVSCTPEIQLERLMTRDDCSRESAEARISSQMPVQEKVKLADYIIDNSGERAQLELLVAHLGLKLQRRTMFTWFFEWKCKEIMEVIISGDSTA